MNYPYLILKPDFLLSAVLKIFIDGITVISETIWAAPWQNQHNGCATNMDPDQHARPRSLIRIHAVRYQFCYL
jgi:hypothetical protein